MQVMIIATKTCSHRPELERELSHMGIPYELSYVEDDPDLAARHGIRHSPNLVVDGEVVFRDLPTEHELRAFFDART